MSKTTGYFFDGSNGTGLIIDPSICTPSVVLNEKSSTGEYSWVASQLVTCALSTSVLNFPRDVDHISTCFGCRVEDQRSMKNWPFGDMSNECLPAAFVIARVPLPSNRTE